MNYIIKSVLMSCMIFWCIGISIAIYDSMIILSYLNASAGILGIYFLSLNFFKNKVVQHDKCVKEKKK